MPVITTNDNQIRQNPVPRPFRSVPAMIVGPVAKKPTPASAAMRLVWKVFSSVTLQTTAPALTCTVWPVIWRLSGRHKNTMTAATSSAD